MVSLLKSLPLTADKLREDELRVSARGAELRCSARHGSRLASHVLLESVAPQLKDIADSLLAWATSLSSENSAASKALLHHSHTLQRLCGRPVLEETEVPGVPDGLRSETRKSSKIFSRCPSRRPSIETSAMLTHRSADEDVFMKLMDRQNSLQRQLSPDVISHREQAANILHQSGAPGEAVDDLQEVPVAEIKDKLAISYWRFCQGLKLYRSPTVTQAMRLICSAAVPGLGGTTYLQVFDTLTQSTAWEQHIYIFGGLVRDILRRTVGNDIDIGFSAPAAELEASCQQAGYRNQVDGDYIIIGDENGEEYLEGMVISYNGIQPPEHADFSMNTLFYDFRNDVIVDKTGKAVPAILANRCDLPCPRDRWKSWIEINGVRVCFRFFKFLLRGYSYERDEMVYVVDTLLDFWRRDADHTIDVGRVALGSLVSCTSKDKIESLRQLVFQSFEMVNPRDPKEATQRRVISRARSFDELDVCRFLAAPEFRTFLSAKSWWEKGWLVLLKLAP